MEYMLMIYENEANWNNMTEEQQGGMVKEYRAFSEAVIKTGQHRASGRLHPVRAATTVRVRNGKVQSTDGPFAETREQLGGYYIIEAQNLDDALQVAAKVPSARGGSIEVRPLWPTPKM